MKFNKYELQTLKYLSFYKLFSIALMIFGCLGIPFGLYANFFRPKTAGEAFLNTALTAASVVLLGSGYLMFHFLKIIEKLKEKVPKETDSAM